MGKIGAIILCIFLGGCLSRSTIQGAAWKESGLPRNLCEEVAKTYPDILKYGLYRKLENGKVEHVNYCDQIKQPNEIGEMIEIPNAQNYTSFNSATLNKWLDELGPEEK